jgi:spore germination protein YaaH
MNNIIPNANKNIVIESLEPDKNKTSNRGKKVLSLILSLVLIIVSVLFFYVYFIRVKVEVDNTKKVVEITEDNKSQREIEEINLSQVEKVYRPVADLQESNLEVQTGYSFERSIRKSVKSLSISSDGIIKKESSFGSGQEVDNILFIKDIDQKNFNSTSKTMVDSLTEIIFSEGLKSIELDVSLTNLDVFMSFLQELNLALIGNNVEIILYTYPRWGDSQNYSYFPSISNQFSRTVSLERIEPLVDKFKILSFDYTSTTSILVGPITPLEWFERVMQYFIFKGIPSQKIIMGINTYVYQWTNRDFAKDYKDNYSVNKAEASLINRLDFLQSIEGSKVDILDREGIDEIIYLFSDLGDEIVSVYPSETQIGEQKELAAEYGIFGIFYR